MTAMHTACALTDCPDTGRTAHARRTHGAAGVGRSAVGLVLGNLVAGRARDEEELVRIAPAPVLIGLSGADHRVL